MSVSDTFRAFALEQLQRTDPEVHARGMFGGVGVYAGTLFFGLMDDDILYFKVDDSNGEVMQYYEVPVDGGLRGGREEGTAPPLPAALRVALTGAVSNDCPSMPVSH